MRAWRCAALVAWTLVAWTLVAWTLVTAGAHSAAAQAQRPAPNPPELPVARSVGKLIDSGGSAARFSGRQEQRFVPGRTSCRSPLDQTLLDLCDGPEYRRRVSEAATSAGVLPRQHERDQWRREMRRWVPCLVERLEDGEACRRLAAVIMLDAIADERAIDPLLRMLDLRDPDADECRTARLSLSRTFEARQVIAYLVRVLDEVEPRASLDLTLALEGYAGGIRDSQLLDALLRTSGRLDPRWSRSLSDAVVWQAASDSGEPRLRRYAEALLGPPVDQTRYRVLQLAQAICPERDCGWYRELYMGALLGHCSEGYDAPIIEYLAVQAGDEGPPFLRRVLKIVSDQRCRARLYGLLIEVQCGGGSGRAADQLQMASCLGEIEPEVRAAVPSAQVMAALTPVCRSLVRQEEEQAASAMCWRAMLPLVRDNAPAYLRVELRYVQALLDSGPVSLDEIERVLEHARAGLEEESGYERQRLAGVVERLAEELRRRQWLLASGSAASTLTLGAPQPQGPGGPWLVEVRGDEAALARIGEVTLAAYLWLEDPSGAPSGCVASVDEVRTEKRSGVRRYMLAAGPGAIESAAGRKVVGVQLLLLGDPETGLRLELSWEDPGAGLDPMQRETP